MKRIALVTGANKGIGFAIAAGLAEAGFEVVVGARSAEAGRAAAARIPGARALQLDVTSDASVLAAAAALGALDVLVNNAGISDPADGSAAPCPRVVRVSGSHLSRW
jgi:NAD(P)-dependent dehydrogenase (short-subunit alcohol dehydrogenase family)